VLDRVSLIYGEQAVSFQQRRIADPRENDLVARDHATGTGRTAHAQKSPRRVPLRHLIRKRSVDERDAPRVAYQLDRPRRHVATTLVGVTDMMVYHAMARRQMVPHVLMAWRKVGPYRRRDRRFGILEIGQVLFLILMDLQGRKELGIVVLRGETEAGAAVVAHDLFVIAVILTRSPAIPSMA
jgi:hypothetical protein